MAAKILVVEDEKNLLRLYQMELEEEGYEVFTAIDGRRALKKLERQPVDLVVLDLELPDVRGLECLQHLMDANREVKVVINTAFPAYKMDFKSWGADAFLIKSSDLTQLKITIANLLVS